jgi:hypothetical protein
MSVPPPGRCHCIRARRTFLFKLLSPWSPPGERLETPFIRRLPGPLSPAGSPLSIVAFCLRNAAEKECWGGVGFRAERKEHYRVSDLSVARPRLRTVSKNANTIVKGRLGVGAEGQREREKPNHMD